MKKSIITSLLALAAAVACDTSVREGIISNVAYPSICKDQFIIPDLRNKKILTFDLSSGEYITNIGAQGRARNEYQFPSVVEIVQDTVVVFDMMTGRINRYSLSGEFYNRLELPKFENGTIAAFGVLHTGEGYIVENAAKEEISRFTWLDRNFDPIYETPEKIVHRSASGLVKPFCRGEESTLYLDVADYYI